MKSHSHNGVQMKSKKISSHIRREQIIEASLRILGDSEVKKLRITDIASCLNLVPSALYRHFKNKDEILMAILDHIENSLMSSVETVRQTNNNTIDQLHELLLLHTQLISKNHGIPRIIFSDEFWGQKGGKRRRLYDLITGYLAKLESIIDEGQKNDEIRKDIDPGVAAKMFLGIIQPGALLSYMGNKNYNIEEHVLEVWPVFKKMLVNQ